MLLEKIDRHLVYDFFDNLVKNSKFKITVIKTVSSRYVLLGKYTILLLIFDVFYIAYEVYKNRNKDFIFLREFNAPVLIASALLCFPYRRKLLANVNHNFQVACEKAIHRHMLRILSYLGVKFFMFDGDGLQASINFRCSLISIPFVVERKYECCRGMIKRKPLIGLIGGYRKEKRLEQTLESLMILRASCDFEILLATDCVAILEKYKNDVITKYTKSKYDYDSAFDAVDILCINYERSRYEWRHSGVIVDALSRGKLILAPAYPIFKNQIDGLGAFFDRIDKMKSAISEVIELIDRSDLDSRFDGYFNTHSVSFVVRALDEKLDSLN